MLFPGLTVTCACLQALLHSVPMGRLVVLDLFAEVKPIWITSEQFYGVPYIWKVTVLFLIANNMMSFSWSRTSMSDTCELHPCSLPFDESFFYLQNNPSLITTKCIQWFFYLHIGSPLFTSKLSLGVLCPLIPKHTTETGFSSLSNKFSCIHNQSWHFDLSWLGPFVFPFSA